MENQAQLQQSLIAAMANQKRMQQQYEQAQLQVKKWDNRTRLALDKGRDDLAQQALIRKKIEARKADIIKDQLEHLEVSIALLQRNSIKLQNRIVEEGVLWLKAKEKIDKETDQIVPIIEKLEKKLYLLESLTQETSTELAKLKVLVAQKLLEDDSSLGMNSAIDVFEQIEEKTIQMEDRSQATAKLADVDLQSQFDEFFSPNDVDDELAALKDQLLSEASFVYVRPPDTPTKINAPSDAAVDAELEALKSQLDQL